MHCEHSVFASDAFCWIDVAVLRASYWLFLRAPFVASAVWGRTNLIVKTQNLVGFLAFGRGVVEAGEGVFASDAFWWIDCAVMRSFYWLFLRAPFFASADWENTNLIVTSNTPFRGVKATAGSQCFPVRFGG